MLNELYDYTKEILNVSVTLSGTRHVDGKAIKIPVTRTFEQLEGKPFIFIKRIPINKKRKKPSLLGPSLTFWASIGKRPTQKDNLYRGIYEIQKCIT